MIFLNIWSHLTIPSLQWSVTDPRTHKRGFLIFPSNERFMRYDLWMHRSNYFGILSSSFDSRWSAGLDGEDWSSTDAKGFLNCTKIMVMLSHPSPPAVDGAKHLSSTLSHTTESLLSCIIYNFYCQNSKGCNIRPLKHI